MMQKLHVTLMFVVNVPEGEAPEDFKMAARQWCTEDPAGFLLARPTLEERLPEAVMVALTPVTVSEEALNTIAALPKKPERLLDCGHKEFGGIGKCTAHGCRNNYAFTTKL